VIFILWVDYTAQNFREDSAFKMVANHMLEQIDDAKHIIDKDGIGYLNPNESKRFRSLDMYIADKNQIALTEPRYSDKGVTITNKAIIRCLELEIGQSESWVSPADYRGVPVLAAYAPIMVDGEKVALIAEIDQSEVREQIYRWWFYADAFWVAVFAAVAGLCLFSLRKDIVRIVRPETHSIDTLSMMIKAVGSFPDEGLALCDKSGLIVMSNRWFAKFVGAFSSTEVIGRNVDSFHSDPAKHKAMREGFSSDILERPVIFVGIDKTDRPIMLSVINLNDTHFLIRMRPSTEAAVGCPHSGAKA
jgi:hypothetical protein